MKTMCTGVSALAMRAAFLALPLLMVAPAQAQSVDSTYTVEFELGSAMLDAAAQATVAEAASSFFGGDSARIDLVGHTDTTGTAEFNQRLSEERAVAVRDALVEAGVPANAITLEAVGESQLIVPTPDGVAEQANRVVVASVLAPEAPVAAAPVPPAAAQPEDDALPVLSLFALGIGPYYGFDLESDGHLLGGNLTLDYFITDNLSVGAEQAVFYAFGQSSNYDEGIGGRSVASLDYHFGRSTAEGGFAPYVGVNVGGVYGEGLDSSFIYGPEVGLTIWNVDAKVAYDIRDSGLDESIISATLSWNFNF